jgi:hypothetical protein
MINPCPNSHKKVTIETETMASEVAQVLEYLPNKCEALSSNPSTAKNCDKKETTFILIY